MLWVDWDPCLQGKPVVSPSLLQWGVQLKCSFTVTEKGKPVGFIWKYSTKKCSSSSLSIFQMAFGGVLVYPIFKPKKTTTTIFSTWRSSLGCWWISKSQLQMPPSSSRPAAALLPAVGYYPPPPMADWRVPQGHASSWGSKGSLEAWLAWIGMATIHPFRLISPAWPQKWTNPIY